MNIALWALQILVGVFFVYAGGQKVFAYDKFKQTTSKHGDSGLSKGLITFIGISEMAGGVGLILPMAAGVAPILTPVAAAALALVMILAVAFHLRRKEAVAFQAVLLVFCAAVAVGRGISL